MVSSPRFAPSLQFGLLSLLSAFLLFQVQPVMPPDAYVEFLIERLATVAVQACESRKPGGVSWTLSHAAVGYNRRAVYADRHAQMYGKTGQPNFRNIEAAKITRWRRCSFGTRRSACAPWPST